VLRDTSASRIRTRLLPPFVSQHPIRPDMARQLCAAADMVDSIGCAILR